MFDAPAPLKTQMNAFLLWDLSRQPMPLRIGGAAVKILIASIRDIADGQLSLRAMSLVYTTLITLAPLLAISFSVLKGFGVHNEIEPWLANYLAPLGEQASEITDRVISFVDNIKVGVLGAAGFCLLIYSVIVLMQKIEAAFNFIWRVNKSRSLVRRFSDYLSVLVFGPCLLFLSAGLTSAARSQGYFDTLNQIGETVFIAPLLSLIAVVIPYLIMAVGFCFFYIYMPNTKVKLRAAFIGGLFAAFAWKIMGWGFSNIIAASTAYVAIYAAFATLILFMVWVYLSWLMILIGANISFYVQNPKYMRYARASIVLSNKTRLALGLSIMEELTNTQYEQGRGLSVEGLAKTLSSPMMAVQNMLDALEASNLIVNVESEKRGGAANYYPAKPLDQITLAQLVMAIERYTPQGSISPKSFDQGIQTTEIIAELEALRADYLRQTLKDCLLAKKQEPPFDA